MFHLAAGVHRKVESLLKNAPAFEWMECSCLWGVRRSVPSAHALVD